MGIMGVMVVVLMVLGFVLDVDVIRIEYYVIVVELFCDLNYVWFGLVYCDLVIGFGF